MVDLISKPVDEGRGLFLLASRLLAAEIDAPLYHALLQADAGGNDGDTAIAPILIDDRIRGLDERQSLAELAVEFCRLFVGPRPACPPYASLQRGEAIIGGRAERHIKEFMERHGLGAVLPPDFPVLAHDHLAVQLALLHRLCEWTPPPDGREPRQAPEALHELLEVHLLPWAPAYLRELQATSRLAPYRTIAELTAQLLTAGPAVDGDGPRPTMQKGHQP